MKKIVNYTCDHCAMRFNKIEDCERHEAECLKEKNDRNAYQRRLRNLSENHSLFYAHSKDDLQNCGGLLFNTELPSSKINFPCLVVIIDKLRFDHWEDEYEISYEVQPFGDFTEKIASTVKEIEIQEVGDATTNPKGTK